MGGIAEGTLRKCGGQKIRCGGNWSGVPERSAVGKKSTPPVRGVGVFEKPPELYCTFHRKNDSTSSHTVWIQKSLRQSPGWRIPPAFLITCWFLFCGRENKQKIFLRVKKVLCFLPFSLVEIINFVLSYVPISCLSLFLLFFVVNCFLNSCNYPSLVHRNEFSRLSWWFFVVNVVILKSRSDNYDKWIKCSSCSRESTCSTCSVWSGITWKLAEERRNYSSKSGSWLRRRRDHKPCLIDQTKKKLMGTLPHMALLPGWEDPSSWQLQGYWYPEKCKSTGHWSLVNWPVIQSPAICPMDKKTFQNGRSPATGQMGITQEFQVSQSPVTGHLATGHWT